jgi:hypothetical protein
MGSFKVRKGRDMKSKATIVFMLACSGLWVSCEDAAPALYVEAVIPPNKDCVVELDSDISMQKGRYDAFCGNGYAIWVRLVSLMRARASSTRPSSEPNAVQFSTAEVQLLTLQDEAIVPKFSTPVFAEVDPGDSAKPGKTLVRIELIPRAIIKSIRGHDNDETITARVKLFGETTGKVDVESDEFSFPIEICSECLTERTMGAGCSLSEDQAAALDDATTCQNHQGYDGSLCFYCEEEDRILGQ